MSHTAAGLELPHRHAVKIHAEYVEHPAARALLKAEQANCAVCRDLADRHAVDQHEVMESLLMGFARKRSAEWRNAHTRYPINLGELVPPPESRLLSLTTRIVADHIIIGSRSGDRVSLRTAMELLDQLTTHERTELLDDVIDAIMDGDDG
ncbi:hypothetical protein [Nocardiopsis coralliicola]